MSLINDMLRDLEDGRRPAPDGETGEHPPGHSRLARRSALWPGVLGGVSVFVVVAAVLLYPASVPDAIVAEAGVSEPPVAELPVAESLIEESRIAETPVSETPALDPVVPQQEERPSPAPRENIDPDTQRQFDQLLVLAATALARDRLTSPIETSAYAYYQQAQRLLPDHPAVAEGLDAIVQRYLELAGELLDRRDFEQARVMLRRGELIQTDHPGLMAMAQLLAEAERSVQIAENTDEPARIAEEESLALAVPETPEAEEAPTEHSVSIQRSQSGQREQIESRLSRYLQQGDTRAAELLLQETASQEANTLPVHRHNYWQARLLLQRGEVEQALTLLETGLEEAQEDERYRALLAGLYHQVGRYTESASSYRRLMERFGPTPGYWLGLALALDARDDHLSALEAYRRANQPGGHQPEVARYIDQRIAALTRRTGS